MIKVLFLTQTPESGASARYRVYQYLDFLKDNGIDCTVSCAVSEELLSKAHSSNSAFTKLEFYLTQVLKRIFEAPGVSRFNAVFLQRDIIIHCYPLIEKIIAGFNRNIVFDFDDAIYLYPTYKKIGWLFNLLWDEKKIERIIKSSKCVIAGNNFLGDYSRRFNSDVTVIPTSVDLNLYSRKKTPKSKGQPIVIGWIGSQGAFGYLEELFPVFEELAAKYPIELSVVGANGRNLGSLKVNYKPWRREEEIDDIYNFDIGVMPIADDEWSRGKCGTKLLQYMAAGVPAIGSAVGANTEIIKQGKTGFLANNYKEWVESISQIIENPGLLDMLTACAREHIKEFYSVQANAPKFLDVIRKAAR